VGSGGVIAARSGLFAEVKALPVPTAQRFGQIGQTDESVWTAREPETSVALPVIEPKLSGQHIRKKNAIFWDVMPCGSCMKRRFGGT
jgi:hypothetical protein